MNRAQNTIISINVLFHFRRFRVFSQNARKYVGLERDTTKTGLLADYTEAECNNGSEVCDFGGKESKMMSYKNGLYVTIKGMIFDASASLQKADLFYGTRP